MKGAQDHPRKVNMVEIPPQRCLLNSTGTTFVSEKEQLGRGTREMRLAQELREKKRATWGWGERPGCSPDTSTHQLTFGCEKRTSKRQHTFLGSHTNISTGTKKMQEFKAAATRRVGKNTPSEMGWECSSGVEQLPIKDQALGSIPSGRGTSGWKETPGHFSMT